MALVSFSVENFLSFREKTTLSMVASDIRDKDGNEVLPGHLIEGPFGSKLVKCAAVYGPNASGKSNLLRAIMVGIENIKNPRDLLRRTNYNDETDRFASIGWQAEGEMYRFVRNIQKGVTTFEFCTFRDGIYYEYSYSYNNHEVSREAFHQIISKSGERKRIFLKELEYPEENESEGRVKIDFGPDFDDSDTNEGKIASLYSNEEESSEILRNRLLLSLLHENQIKVARDFLKSLGTFRFLKPTGGMSIPGRLIGTERDIVYELYMNKSYLDLAVKFANNADTGISSINLTNPEELAEYNEKGDSLRFSRDFRTGLRTGRYDVSCVHKVGDDEYEINLNDESDGTRRFLFLCLHLLEYEGKAPLSLLLIDEIGSSMHPELIRVLLQKVLLGSNENTQLIFTTHHAELMDDQVLRKDEVWFTEKSRDTLATELFSLSDFDLPEKIDKNRRASYLMGRFGAVPHLKKLERMIDE